MENEHTFSTEVRRYAVGGVLALAITFFVFISVEHRLWNGAALAAVALFAAVLQFMVQVKFFLHLKRRAASFEQRLSFAFTIIMLLVVVVGSLWVMMNLNYHMGMTGRQMDEYMIKQNKKGF